MNNKTLKKKKCAICRQPFLPFRTTTKVCGWECAAKLAEQARVKIERKQYREAKTKLKSRSDWMREAQTAFNSYIRARDTGKPCISCGSRTGKKNAGHYRSVGSCPELRFEPLQVWLQCEHCNSYLSGNLINYRIELERRIGTEKLAWIEGPHEPKKYSIDDLKAIKAEYKAKLKALQKGE